MPAASFNDHARVMLCLPATADEIAAKCGMTQRGVFTLMRRLWALRMVYPGGKQPTGPRAHPVAVWMAGEGQLCECLRVRKPLRPRAQHIAFASMWELLRDGSTAHGLADDTGCSRVSVYRLLAVLKGHVRIVSWERDSVGRPVAVWAFGQGASAQKPRKLTAGAKWDRYHRRVAYRALTLLGAAA
jgi:CRP-like cAMP-binding protein